MMVSPDDVKKIIASAACSAHSLTKWQQYKSQTFAWADNRPLQRLGTRILSKYEPSVPTLTPTDKADSPVALAAIVIGCVGLVTASMAVGFALRKSTMPKVFADNAAPVAPVAPLSPVVIVAVNGP